MVLVVNNQEFFLAKQN